MLVVVRGGGDLGSGVILRLVRAGFAVVVLEMPMPLAVRRSVSFAEAVYSGEVTIEGIRTRRTEDVGDALALLENGIVPVLIDPTAESLEDLRPQVLVDARLTKHAPELAHPAAPLVIGLGPGFVAGVNCHCVIETQRGHFMGRVYWQGTAAADTGQPESVANRQADRVLRAPASGKIENFAAIGDRLQSGDRIASVAGVEIRAPFDGLLRGLVASGLPVYEGMKIGDLDPRLDPRYVQAVSDKALAMGGGVLEAILTALHSGQIKE